MKEEIREKLHQLLDEMIDNEEPYGLLSYADFNDNGTFEDWFYEISDYRLTLKYDKRFPKFP